MATYGGDTPENRFTFKGKTLYSIVDVETGETTFYEDKGIDTGGRDIKLGTLPPGGGDFVPHEGSALGPLYPDGFSDVFVGDDAKAFLSDEGQKELRSQATETAVRAQKESGVDEVTARKRAEEILQNGNATTPPDADPDTLVNDRLNSLSDLKIENKQELNLVQVLLVSIDIQLQ